MNAVSVWSAEIIIEMGIARLFPAPHQRSSTELKKGPGATFKPTYCHFFRGRSHQ